MFNRNLMNQPKSKTGKISIAIATILLLTMGLFAVSGVQPAQADTSTSASYAFIAVNPNPAGVDQSVYVNFWLSIPPPTAGAASGDRWQGLSVTITKPDNTTETKTGYQSDAVGGAHFVYAPTMTGVYKFQMHFPGQQIGDVQYEAADSLVVELTVQEQPAAALSSTALPNNFWAHPINAQNQAWSCVSSNWLMAGRQLL